MGKKLTFTGFLLALMCLLPTGIYMLVAGEEQTPSIMAKVTLIGFPLFALVSFVGMITWAFSEIRNAKKQSEEGRQP